MNVFEWGPNPFLIFYASLLLLCILSGVVLRRKISFPLNASSNSVDDILSKLTISQLAYLRDGARGAINVAIVALCQQEKMKVAGEEFEVIDHHSDCDGSVDELLQQTILSMANSGESLIKIRRACGTAVVQIRRSLVKEKLIDHRWLLWCRRLLLFGIMSIPLVIGLVRLRNGAALGRPVGYLIGLLIVTMIASWFFVMTCRKVTRLGKEVLRHCKKQTPAPRRSAIVRAGFSREQDPAQWSTIVLRSLAIHSFRNADRSLETGDSVQLLQENWSKSNCIGDTYWIEQGGSSGCGGGGCGGEVVVAAAVAVVEIVCQTLRFIEQSICWI